MPSRRTAGNVVTLNRRCRALLREASAVSSLQAMLVSRPQDVSYFSGFTGEDSFLLVARRWGCLITDGRYDEQAAAECPHLDVHARRGSIFTAVGKALKGRRVRSLGVQAGHLTLAEKARLAEAIGGRKIRETTSLAYKLRARKDDDEVRAITRSIRAAERAFGELVAGGAKALVGRTERDVAAELDYRMRLAGASGPAFETIVAAGAHGSRPHYRPDGTRIRRGQAVLIDWGALVEGYCSDLTRVVFLATIPPKLARIYEVVRRAQQAGIAAIRPGVSGARAHKAAADVIDRAGYGEKFVHGLGHGVGLEIHEAPGLGPSAKTRLRAGMVVTVEPGIYLPGIGGVRIEDDVLVTAKGRRRLSRLTRDLDDMVLS